MKLIPFIVAATLAAGSTSFASASSYNKSDDTDGAAGYTSQKTVKLARRDAQELGHRDGRDDNDDRDGDRDHDDDDHRGSGSDD